MFDFLRNWMPKKRVKIEMPDVIISRGPSTDQGTFGILIAKSVFICKTCELPDRDNITNFSCIPVGKYTCAPYQSKKFGSVYIVENVEGRTYILTHTGNLAGDTKKKFRTHSAGCILLGKYIGNLGGQKSVMVSRPVVRSFRNLMGNNKFTLEIREAKENGNH